MDSCDCRAVKVVPTDRLPRLSAAVGEQASTDLIADGELVAFEDGITSFPPLQQLLARGGPVETGVWLYVFDLLWSAGRDLRPLPLSERKPLLEGALAFEGPLRPTAHRVAAHDRQDVLLAEACERGWEGLIAKRPTGSAGFHVHVPLDGAGTQALARDVAKAVATITARRHPSELTVEHRRVRRTGRVLIDWFRNSPAQTAIAPYSVRAHPSAPVATPMDWSELPRTRPQRWTMTSLPPRLAQQGDVWATPITASDLHELAPTIAAALAEG